jgi:hypothetical protein
MARSNRSLTIAGAAREYVWLWDYRHGTTTQEIADREHLSERRVRFGLARARSYERPTGDTLAAAPRAPRLEPIFPIGMLVLTSLCPHFRPIRVGSVIYCVVCDKSGMDAHPALKRSPATDPPPEKKPEPPAKPSKEETRKQKRARLAANIARSMKSA